MNAKVQRPGVCNAMETLLVDRSFAREHLHKLALIWFVKMSSCSFKKDSYDEFLMEYAKFAQGSGNLKLFKRRNGSKFQASK